LTKSLKKELIFKKLIEIRKTNNFTQRQLARRLSVYQSYVSKVELGQKNLNIIELEDYLKGLNYSLIEFLNTLDKMSHKK
jgi:transcriptional regulator with XRE-family HTH domain